MTKSVQVKTNGLCGIKKTATAILQSLSVKIYLRKHSGEHGKPARAARVFQVWGTSSYLPSKGFFGSVSVCFFGSVGRLRGVRLPATRSGALVSRLQHIFMDTVNLTDNRAFAILHIAVIITLHGLKAISKI